MLDERKLFEEIKRVCGHPKKYVWRGTFDGVARYLEKYGGKNCWVGNIYYHSVFTPFLQWFVEKKDVSDKGISLKSFRQNFSSDEDAIKSLPILYEEYLSM